jgi:hypothetical protein
MRTYGDLQGGMLDPPETSFGISAVNTCTPHRVNASGPRGSIGQPDFGIE